MRRTLGSPLASVVVAAVLVVTAAGCGSDQPETSTEDPSSQESESPMPTDEPTTTPPSRSPVVVKAIADLAQRQGVPESAIELVSQEEVTWRNGSLGCAKEGTMYTQALVDGSRVVLGLDGEEYEYHSGADGEPFWCEEPTQ